MKTNKDRQKHFATFSSPVPGEKGYDAVIDFHKKRIEENPKYKKELEQNFQKAITIFNTQMKNGIGLAEDKDLRFFFAEFNERLWKFGFKSMPASFNVMEAFFRWDPELFLFELFDEEEHLFSMFDFVDFITSKNCTGSIDTFIENIEDDIIFSYNILNEVKEITFKTNDFEEYVVGGVSFIKRGNEVSMLMVTAMISDTATETKKLPDTNKGKSHKPYLEKNKDLKHEAAMLFNQRDLWKHLVYLRINLETKTIESRYIQKDQGDSFSTVTDDIGTLKRSLTDDKDLDGFIEDQIKKIKNYDSIFELAQQFLFLPEYFDFFDNFIINEEHPTGLKGETIRKPVFKKSPVFSSTHFFKFKDVWSLDRSVYPKNKNLILRQSELTIEKNGYWKYLEQGQVGKDRNGNPIHNRSWVEQTLSWYETQKRDNVEVNIIANPSVNSGFIYLMRNAAHKTDLFKIGLTTLTAEERAKQLSGTPSPDKFLIMARWPVIDCFLAEKIIHEKLAAYRLNPKREFFQLNVEEAITIINPIIQMINQKSEEKKGYNTVSSAGV